MVLGCVEGGLNKKLNLLVVSREFEVKESIEN